MTEGDEAPPPLPGTLMFALILTVVNALIGLFFPPSGWLWAAVYGAGAYGLWLSRTWAFWLLVVATTLSWILTVLAGRFELISTTPAIFVLLMTPSARAHFGVGRASKTT